MMFKIVASDLDGTLLTPSHQIAPYTRSILQKLHNSGRQFVFATGRHHIDVMNFQAQLGIPSYMITANGACVHSPDHQLLYQQDLDPDVVSAAINATKHETNLKIHIYRENDWLLDREDPTLKNVHDGQFTYQIFDVEQPPLLGIAKLFFTIDDLDHEKLVIWEDKFKQAFGDRANIAFSTPWCLEIMNKNVSKGDALAMVAHHLNATLDDCIAFGDGMNDVELLSMAGKGLIMSTAHDKVKRALPDHEIIGGCDQESVAHYLEDHLLQITNFDR